ncbi:MAG: DUF4147 domain-containing protein [Gemmatimonadales bacterium]
MHRTTDRLRLDAVSIYEAGLAGVDPRRVLTRALATTAPPGRVRLLAMGKAAMPMAAAAVQHLDRLDIPIVAGVLVTPDAGGTPDPRLVRIVGDHPMPGRRSEAAARAVADAVAQTTTKEEVWVLLSGGTTSLIGAPATGISATEYDLLLRLLARAGLPISRLNAVRKRFSRWGAGRLAVECRAERIRVYALSDVPGDDLADIGSGPCSPDPTTAAGVRGILEAAGVLADLPPALLQFLDRVERGEVPETPKPGHPSFDRVAARVIASNRTAVAAAGARAEALGYRVVLGPDLLQGEAAAAGAGLLEQTGLTGTAETAWIGGAETTVALGSDHGRGGRCQELALAAARRLAEHPNPVAVLAAGTDGRDGPTDAAGAVVTNETWAGIRAAGADPGRALARHDAYPALAAVGALLRPGLTGTNVMDLIIALAGSPPPASRSERGDPAGETGSRSPAL